MVNPTRLLVLGMLAGWGRMHGYEIKQSARRAHLEDWSAVQVGSLYYAIKQLTMEGLVRPSGVEQRGVLPARRLLEITDAGRSAFHEMVVDAFDAIPDAGRTDAFDVALCVSDVQTLDRLEHAVGDRLRTWRRKLDEVDQARVEMSSASQTPATAIAVLSHVQRRCRTEVEWLEELLGLLPAIRAEVRQRRSAGTEAHRAVADALGR